MQWKLIKLRRERDVTQKALAEYLGISLRAYSMKERGETDFKLPEMVKIHRFFNVTMDEIFLPIDCILNAERNHKEETK